MDLYLDTADRAEAEPLLATGLFSGLTTNPTILRRAGLGVSAAPDIYRWATAAGAREVFFQSWGGTVDELISHGFRLRDLGPEVVVKVPASRAGASACARLVRHGVPTLLTAVYAPEQALVAAAAGATYLAPYLGRLDDAGRDGLGVVRTMQRALRATGASTRILLASVRDPQAMVAAAEAGVDAFTIGPAVADALFADPSTAAAVEEFEDAVRATSA